MIPLLSIYQPNTIDNAIALPGDVLLLIDVSNALPDAALLAVVAVPVTLPVTLPVRFPLKDVEVVTPVTTTPLGRVGDPVSSLFTISSTWIFDIVLFF